MRLLYLGTVCNLSEYEKMASRFKKHPSVASLVFESALLSGMRQHNIQIDVFSFPMIPNYRYSKILSWGQKKECLASGYECRWIPTINVPILKTLSRRVNGKNMVKKWLIANKDDDCAVLMYSICPFLSSNVIDLCRKYGKKCFVIVPDLPRNMFLNHPYSGIKKFIADRYLLSAMKVQSLFDGYVYITESMKEVISSDAPFTVVEGIADTTSFDGVEEKKSLKRVIIYAGRLHEKYGIKNLIEAYLSIPHNDMELHLFGTGTFEEEIRKYSENDDSIKFYGQVNRSEMLSYELGADLLVNCRNAADDYVRYSFPSKTLEYMLSGTPVLTTRLPGIPEEYFQYLFAVEDNSVETLATAINTIFSYSPSYIQTVGERARQYVKKEKNAYHQSAKIIALIENVINDIN